MHKIEQALAVWKNSLCSRIEIDSLISRNPIAHKWKATYRILALRECAAWRVQDLLSQSIQLYNSSQILGARILLRSAFETLSMLIYSNILTGKVLDGSLDFHEYSKKTSVLLLGSKDGSTNYPALNIMTIIEKADVRYPGLKDLYQFLSESAHPNYQGMSVGYSSIDHESYITTFSNQWPSLYKRDHLASTELCMFVFNAEYNDEWEALFEKLESWLTENDAILNKTLPDRA